MPVQTCDPRSFWLAEHVLEDDYRMQGLTPQEVASRTMHLALTIQQAIEDWLAEEEAQP
jgi:hypothetical protein